MAVIGSLLVRLGMNSAAFDKGLRRSRKNLSGFQRGIAGVSASLKRMAVIAGTALAAVALKRMVRSSMETIDATAKLSDRLGITTQDLQRLQHAAGVYGTTTTELNKSLEIMSRRLGESMAGTGEAIRGLKLLGLTAKELVTAGPAEAFKIVAERTRQLATQAEKAAAAYYLFGRSGAKLVNMLSIGRRGLERYGREMDRIGVYTRAQAAWVEEANDAMGRLNDRAKVAADTIAIALSPAIVSVTASLERWATASGTTSSTVIATMKGIAKAFAFVGDGIRVLEYLFKATQITIAVGFKFIFDLFDKMAKVVENIINKMLKYTKIIGYINPAFGKLLTNLQKFEFGGLFGRMSAAMTATIAELNKELAFLMAAPTPLEKVTTYFAKLEKGLKKTAEAAAEVNNQMAGGGAPGAPAAKPGARPARVGEFRRIESYRVLIKGLSSMGGDTGSPITIMRQVVLQQVETNRLLARIEGEGALAG